MSGVSAFVRAVAALLIIAFPATAFSLTSATEISDLGKAEAGRIDVFEINVHNPICAEPQNFRFVPHNLPWIRLTHGDRVLGVSRGQRKVFSAEINLSGLKPGRYEGDIAIICDTCGSPPLSMCDIDKRSVLIKVEIVPQ